MLAAEAWLHDIGYAKLVLTTQTYGARLYKTCLEGVLPYRRLYETDSVRPFLVETSDLRRCAAARATRLQQWLFTVYEQATGRSTHEQVHADMAALFDYATTEPEGFALVFATEAEDDTAVWQQLVDAITTRIATLIRDNLAEHALRALSGLQFDSPKDT